MNELQEMGFTRETAPLVYLTPLVQVAWAEGRLSEKEREMILAAARSRGILEGGPADQILADWFNWRPADAFFEKTLHVAGALLRALPPNHQEAQKRDLISACTRIAEASGGVIGFLRFETRVSKEEQGVIACITAELDRSHEAESKEMVGE